MLKYNDQNIFVGEIKQLLKSFNLPQCPVWSSSDTYYEGEHYIKGNNLYMMTSNTESKAVDTYKFGDSLPHITKNLEIRSTIYDSYTHTYLGNYLRFIRDYTGVNLMPLYNCFTNELVSNLKVDVPSKHSFYSSNSRTKIYMIPVKFGKSYTIGIDCNETVCMFCGCYSSNKYISLDSTVGFESASFRRKSGLRFNHPFLFTVNACPAHERQLEGCLKLFIEVPATLSSSITVLEGDYTKCCDLMLESTGKQKIGQRLLEYKDVAGGKLYGNYNYLFKPQLLSINTQEIDLVSDRLIEYLTGAVISPLDKQTDDVAFLQNKMYSESLIKNIGYDGIWSEDLRKGIYSLISTSGLVDKKKDMLSYCDKDVESKLGSIYIDQSRKTWRV
jgi:hypothetical protein